MSTTSSPSSTASEGRASMDEALVPVAVMATATALTLMVIGADSLSERLVLAPVIIMTSALVFGVVVRTCLVRPAGGNAALTMSVLAMLLDVTAFWAGVPFILGVAGAMLGWAGHTAVHGSVKAAAAFALGSLAAVSYLAIYATDLLAH